MVTRMSQLDVGDNVKSCSKQLQTPQATFSKGSESARSATCEKCVQTSMPPAFGFTQHPHSLTVHQACQLRWYIPALERLPRT
mmetsp:Transcript_64821/g.171576  ORF Transcript_64821/g.171576 Transcript_64821/m.171576 type:complete len:83 (-) Transcript_64821:98-346(-)